MRSKLNYTISYLLHFAIDISKYSLIFSFGLNYSIGHGQEQQLRQIAISDSEIRVPMEPKYWQNDSPRITFEMHQSQQALHILPHAGRTKLNNLDFSHGTIEFDWQPTDLTFSSFYFRHQSTQETECVYLRTERAGDPFAMDAVQYAPFLKGVNLWDLLGHYQGPANFSKSEWNHVKLVISEKQMDVYINDQAHPVLQIPKLEGNTNSGTLAFEGEGLIANLSIKPGVTEGLSPFKGIDPTYNDPRYLRHWLVSAPFTFPYGREPVGDDLPAAGASWEPIAAERRGLINLTRRYGITPERRLIWLKTTITSLTKQRKQLNFGFSDEVWMILNGRYLYVDKNYYAQPIMKYPQGRCSIENITIALSLEEGNNELLIGVANNFFGWGIIAQLQDLENITAINQTANK